MNFHRKVYSVSNTKFCVMPLLTSVEVLILQLMACNFRAFVFTFYFQVQPSVLWRCWLGGRKGIWPVKNLRGVLGVGAPLVWFGSPGLSVPLLHKKNPEDRRWGNPAWTQHSPMLRQKGRVFLLVPAYPGCPGTKAVKRLLLLLWFSFQVLSFVVNSACNFPWNLHCSTIKHLCFVSALNAFHFQAAKLKHAQRVFWGHLCRAGFLC